MADSVRSEHENAWAELKTVRARFLGPLEKNAGLRNDASGIAKKKSQGSGKPPCPGGFVMCAAFFDH